MAGRQTVHWRRARVRSTRDLGAPGAGGVRRIVLEPEGDVPDAGVSGVGAPGRGTTAAVPPGSHLDVVVHVDGRPETRSYSLVDDGHDPDALVLGVRLSPDSRGGSRYMHGLTPGATITVTEPLQTFELTLGRPRYLLLAGGIGITPILGMARALRDTGADYRVVYAGHTATGLAFRDHLLAEHPGHVELAVSEEGTRLDLAALVADTAPDTELYVCGPMRMLEEARRHWRDAGRPASRLRFETFGSSGTHPAEEFRVRIPRLGISATVPRDTTMLDALRAAGADMMYDCLRGECGLCEVRVLRHSAPIDHRDVFLSDRQKGAGESLCTCVSRVAGGEVDIDVP